MEWFYNISTTEKAGPVTALELLNQQKTGVISSTSLIWTENQSDWVTFDAAKSRIVADALDSDPELVTCAFSGDVIHRDDALEYGDKHVLPQHKDQFVQLLAEGHEPNQAAPLDKYGAQLTFSAVWNRTWDIFRSHFLLLAAIYALVWIPLNLIGTYMDLNVWSTMTESDSFKQSMNFDRFLNSMGGIIAIAAFFQVCMAHTRGDRPTFNSAMSTGFKLWGKIWVTRFIQGFFMYLLVIVCLIPVIIAAIFMQDYSSGGNRSSETFLVFNSIWIMLGLIAAVIFPLLGWFFSRIAFSLPYLAETGVGGWAAMKKSFQLTKGRVWRIIGYYTLVFLIVAIPMIAPAIPTAFPPFDTLIPTSLLLTISGIASSFFIVFTFAFYKQLRISIGEDGMAS